MKAETYELFSIMTFAPMLIFIIKVDTADDRCRYVSFSVYSPHDF